MSLPGRRQSLRNCATAASICRCGAGCGGAPWPCPRCFPIMSRELSPRREAHGMRASWQRSHHGATSVWQAYGLGAYIANATRRGDFHRIVLGIAVMSLFVVVVNGRCGGHSTGTPNANSGWDDAWTQAIERSAAAACPVCLPGFPESRTASELLVLDDINLDARGRRDRRPAGPFRLGQIDAAAPDRGARAAEREAASSISAGRSLGPRPASPWCSRASRCFPG